MILLKKCPSCGSKRIKRVRRNLKRSYRSKSYTVPAVDFQECPDCGEQVYGKEAMRKIEAHSPAFAGRQTHA